MKLADLIKEALRLNILLALAKAPDYRASAPVLHTVLERSGTPASLNQLTAALDWLGEQELVELERLGTVERAILVAQLTTAGLDVAQGRELAQGVRRPLPGEVWQG